MAKLQFLKPPLPQKQMPLELIELLNYLADRKPEEIEMVRSIAQLIFEQNKH